MANNPNIIPKVVKVTSVQLSTLAGGGTITKGTDTYTADENTIYLTDDTSVSFEAQSLSSSQQAQARSNIGAGTSSFSGSYDDLSNKPTIPTTTASVTQNSTAALTSGGAYTALANKADKSSTVSDVSYDSNNKKIQKTINGTTTDVITLGDNAFTSTTIPTTTDTVASGNSSALTSNGAYSALNLKADKTIVADYTLSVANWSSNQYTLSVTGKTATNNARVGNSNSGVDNAAVLANAQAISDANIYRIIDNGTSLTFVCETTPIVDLLITVEVYE